jgi:hypothetical protein
VLVFSGFELFSYKQKKMTQIDILALTGDNVFVMELKRFTTKIEGAYSERSWYGFSGERKYGIYNPIFQNGEHLRSLQAFFRSKGLRVSDFEWISFVVVPDSCVIKADRKYVVSEGRAFNAIYSCKRFPVRETFYTLFLGS